MKTRFAIVEGQRREAERGISGVCPLCGQAMIAKCGEHRVWHWAHRANRNCDTWYEPETEWHLNWKNLFPNDWQEVVRRSNVGEKHIADVKTENGTVLEFQHSFLRGEERQSRENFYGNMFWVVDGLRRKRDRPRFFVCLAEAGFERHNPATFSVRNASDECALLRDWVSSQVPVFFDFGDTSEPSDLSHLRFDKPVLWLMYPESSEHIAYLCPVAKDWLLDAWLNGRRLNFSYVPAVKHSTGPSAPVSRFRRTRRSRRPMTFRQYVAWKELARKRRRF